MAKAAKKRERVPALEKLTADYVPSAAEAAIIEDYLREAGASPPRMKVERQKDGKSQVKVDHPNRLVGQIAVTRAVGTYSAEAANWLLTKLGEAVALSRDGFNEEALNGALAMLHELKPRDEVESMLIAQMVATHSEIANRMRALRTSETIPQLEANGTLLTKLQRTFTAQLEALQRYRGRAPQQVRVEHVHVHQGGQAIVGTVQAGAPEQSKSTDQSHAQAITHDPGETLSGDLEAVGKALPVAGRKGLERVPDARSRRRRTERK
jgi:hypothetical protein